MSFVKILSLVLLMGVFSVQACFSQGFFKRHRSNSTEMPDSLLKPYMLPELTIKTSRKAYASNYARTKSYVLKTISLANFIRDLNSEIDNSLVAMGKKRDKKKYLKAEREKLFSSFSDIVKDMSLREGQVFNKLVYRQAGITTYEIIEKYQGGLKAVMWQSVSRLGGANLKLTYDPYYSDKVIEDVMKQIESGKLKTPRIPRTVEEFNNPVYD
ncbi:MAG TPA: DUF4294 domain-containing protein [Flavobacteriales bacterium]|nr:DUF4294 domain-containing protein [Flavobacteriales bacterium]